MEILKSSGNIPGNDINKGQELLSYLQPFPPRGTGCQRLIFVLFKQDKRIDFSKFQKPSPWYDICYQFRCLSQYNFLNTIIQKLTAS